ncbi:glycoside hydrolase family protein [Bordetella genomosp. 2]|uniref:Lysozyme n=1 Tax=Bordetella genomosp. 2 TaxID=1983456 RepID=A0A261W0Z9_9BORD|nr:glycoside hydrolase family protein [Bordetella genomosp. 2]OZI79929.1 lysozyme [Bordetella genomosp. 2]
MINELTRLLRGDEGEVLHAYQDHLGYWTIGVGRLIDKRKGGGISRTESALLLSNDIAEKEAELDRRLPWWRELPDARRAVILAMAFQMGVDGLLSFKNTLALVRADNFDGAARGMLASLWARQTPERAHRMAEQMRTNTWHFKEGT